MHPAKSVIYFTTATGAGYGLFIWLAILVFAGLLPDEAVFRLIALSTGFGLIVSGLLSSTLHLGHPRRAWRALSQWRSSWLSREGVAAVLSIIPLGLFALVWLFLDQQTNALPLFAGAGAALSLVTVTTTAMIYASLKAIPAWHNVWTKAGYLILALMSGAVLVLALCVVFEQTAAAAFLGVPTLGLLVLGAMVKLIYWRHIHARAPVSTAQSATGLGRFGKVSLIESPHSEANYLLKEMGFKIARKHAAKIRGLAFLFGFFIPFALIALLVFMPLIGFTGYGRAVIALAALLSCGIGLGFERWLFFAEAKHVVMLYYGEREI